jgi:hypothetical protein
MTDWVPVEGGAKNDKGEYVAKKDGQWIPAKSVAKNDKGEYMALFEANDKPQQTMDNKIEYLLDIATKINPASLALEGIQKGQEGYDMASQKAGDVARDLTQKAGGSPELSGAVGAGVYTAAQMAEGGGIGGAAKPLMEKFAEKSMSSALKPSLPDIVSGDAAKAIQTMLDENIPVTKTGMEKLQAKITDLNNQIKEKIASSGETIDGKKLTKYMDELTNKFLNQVNYKKDIKAIRESWNEFIHHPLIESIDKIPVQAAQKIKQGTYQRLADKAYGEVGTASTEAQKTEARFLKDKIAEKVPAVAELNKKESELLNALTLAEKKALYDVAKDPAMLTAMYHSPQFIAAASLGKSAAFKSTLANIVYRNSRLIPAAAGVAYKGEFSPSYQNN